MKLFSSTRGPFSPQAPGTEMPILAWLVSETPAGLGQYALHGASCRIGRAPDNDIYLNHDTVSSLHAEIRYLRGSFFNIEDLNSTNGVLVNGHKAKTRILRDGDLLELGEVRLRFQVVSNASQHPMK